MARFSLGSLIGHALSGNRRWPAQWRAAAPKAAYDASKYAGIAFWAKKGENSTPKVRLKVPDGNTDPDGAVCTECFNDFGGDLSLTTEWKLYVYPWKAMKQMPGWGNPRKPHITPSKLYGVQFQVNIPSATYDICVDDLQFICSSAGGCGNPLRVPAKIVVSRMGILCRVPISFLTGGIDAFRLLRRHPP